MGRALSYLLVLACLTRPDRAINARDCLQCWRDVCTQGNPSLDTSFLNDCCTSDCIGSDLAQCLTTATDTHNSSDCCTIAETNLLPEPPSSSHACQISESDVFNTPEERHTNALSLQEGTYVVPRFMFNCSGCIEEVEVQGLGTFEGDSITMKFMTWTRLNDRDLYRLKSNVSITTTDIEIDGSMTEEFDITFSFSESNQLCFENNEELGFSLEDNANKDVNIGVVEDGSQLVYELMPSTSDTCSNLNDVYEISTTINGVPLVIVHTRPPPIEPTSTDVFPSSILYPSSSYSSDGDTTTLPGSTSRATPKTSFIIIAIIGGVIGGGIFLVFLVCVVLLAVFVIRQCRHHHNDKIDGSGPVDPFYQDLDPQGQNTLTPSTMLPAGSVREGALTPVTSGLQTVHSIHDDDFTNELVPTHNTVPPAYDYIPTTDGNDIITTSPNEAYATTDNVPVSSNQAYGMVQH